MLLDGRPSPRYHLELGPSSYLKLSWLIDARHSSSKIWKWGHPESNRVSVDPSDGGSHYPMAPSINTLDYRA